MSATPQLEDLCPEADNRRAMSDGDFWEHVLLGGVSPDFDRPDVDDLGSYQNEPCPECGEHTACAYDSEGRPMIHITNEDDGREIEPPIS